MHVWALWLSCETPAAPKPHDSLRRAHWRVPALQTPPKFHEKTPRERRTNEISGGSEKKREISGPPPFGPPTLRAPHPLGPHPFRPQPLQAHFPRSHHAHHPTRQFSQTKLAKFGQIKLAKCGQLNLAKCGIGQLRFGQMRPNQEPRMVLPRRVGGPKFRVFSFSATIFLLSSLSEGPSVEFFVVFEAPGS